MLPRGTDPKSANPVFCASAQEALAEVGQESYQSSSRFTAGVEPKRL